MRILIVGASGVLGRATLPHLGGHEVVGTTRAAGKRKALTALGAHPEICDVYETGALEQLARACAPEIVVTFLTDLAGGVGPANSRIRLEGGPVVVMAAHAAGARRLIVESIAFSSGGASGAALAALEHGAFTSGLETLVLRFGRFWCPGTWADVAPEAPSIHVAEAGRRAADLILGGPSGLHIIAGSEGPLTTAI
jgi:nucleoside-diphosphate-sugar epimerase